MAFQGDTLKSTSINGVKMYTVSGNDRSTWLDPKKKRALRKDKEYMRRVELIQDLRFETATTKIKATPDGEYLIASGIYPPQVKVYELRELALKFERHLVSEIIDFEVLSDDYSKIAFLCADRSVRLHAKYGSHYSLRIPRMGRDLAYDCWSCDLLCAASSPDLYRINLDQGRFLSPLKTHSPALNVVSQSKLHGLVACGGDDGAVECFDLRARSSIGRIDAVAPTGDIEQEVTALEFEDNGGSFMAVGSSTGKVLIYDLRKSYPVRIKDHMYGTSILNIKWHWTPDSKEPNLITTDKQIVRIWNPLTGEGMASIEPSDGNINDSCIFSNSGLILLALDGSRIPSYFIPVLGSAPNWCSYLQNLTGELEEDAQTTTYNDYKFVTREDLEKLNLSSQIGTESLKAFMHGFLIDYHLYKKVESIVEPFKYDTYIEQHRKEKMEAERINRITLRKKLPKVNRRMFSNITEAEEAENEKNDNGAADTKKSKKKRGMTREILSDERFEGLFNNKDFEIDEESAEYLALHPMPSSKQQSLVEEHFEPVMGIDGEDLGDSDAIDEPQSSDDETYSRRDKAKKQPNIPRMYEVKDERHAEAFTNSKSLGEEHSLSMGERVATLGDGPKVGSHLPKGIKFGPGGSREISFLTKSKAKYVEDEEDVNAYRPKKRGVQSLGLKPDRPGIQGRGRGGGRRGGGGRGKSKGRGRR